MGVVLSVIVLFGGTLELVDGEMFEGRVLGQSDKKIWLELDSGGILVFDKSRVARLHGRPLKPESQERSSDSKAAKRPQHPPQQPNDVERSARPRDSSPADRPPRKDPRAHVTVPARPPASASRGTQPSSGQSVRPSVHVKRPNETTPFGRTAFKPSLFRGKRVRIVVPSDQVPEGQFIHLTCPVRFRLEQKKPEPPCVGVLVEDGSGVRVTVRARPFRRSLKEALSEIRSEIGAYIMVERSVRVRGVDSRLFEWEQNVGGQVRSNLTIVLLKGGTLYRVTASVQVGLIHGYRDILVEILKSLELPPEPAALAEPSPAAPPAPSTAAPAEPPAASK